MQKIEPTGQLRLEWYFAKLITAMEVGLCGSKDNDWRNRLIGYEQPEQTMEQMLATLNRFEQQF